MPIDISNFSKPQQDPAEITSPPGLASLVQCSGHSLTSGFGLANSSLRASSRLAGLFNSSQEWNQSIAGAVLGWTDTSTNPGGISWLSTRLPRYRKRAPYSGDADVVLLQYGKNDVNNVGLASVNAGVPTAQGLSIFLNSLRTALTLFRASARLQAGDKTTNLDATIALNTGANWSNVATAAQPSLKRGSGAVVGSKVGYITTTTNGATGALTVTVPGDYPGSAICPLFFQFVADNALTAGTITASGGVTGTYDLFSSVGGVHGRADSVIGQKNLVTWRFTGASIPAANGTPFTITLTPSALAGGTWGFAEWGIEAESPPVIAVLDITKDNPAGGFWSNVTNASLVTWNAGIANLIATEFTDGTVYFVPVDTIVGGGGQLASSTLNGAITTGAPATGGVLPITSTTGWPQTGALMIAPGTNPAQEIITWTGVSGNTLTGITRGAYGTAATAYNSLTAVAQLLPAAIANFYTDGVHWTERTQGLVAGAVSRAISVASQNPATNSNRVGPGRADIRCQLGCSASQILPPGTITPLFWNQSLIDTAILQDPTAAPGVAGNPGSYTRIFAKDDGLYAINATVNYTQGKAASAGAAATAGVRNLYIRKNGVNTNLLAVSTVYPTTADQNSIISCLQSVNGQIELRAGDFIEIIVYCQAAANQGVIDSLGAAVTTTGQTAWTVASGAGIVNNDYLRCDDEIVLVTAGGGTASLTVTRAQLGTTAATHLITASAFTGVAVQANSPLPTFTMYRQQAI